ncbi:MAG: hypothetical protein V4681_03870 [Patescibacteria group bacterium]
MTKEKIGLVIQGPLLSIGNEGKKAHIQKKVLGEKGFVRYDCRENIQRMIDEYGALFDTIVVATWDSEVLPDDGWKGATLVSMPDPGEVRRRKYTTRSRNKYRQFIGIRHGLIELEKLADVEYVVRVRTDTYVDLRKLLDSFFAGMQNDSYHPGSIGVPLARPVDYFIHDFYFIARREALKDFCDAILAFDLFEFISCVHRDSILKYAYVQFRDAIEVPGSAYFPHWPPCGASAQTKRIFSYMLENVFVPLDSAIFRTLLWRGSLLSEPHLRQQLGEGMPSAKRTPDVPAFISTHWERYFLFLCETEGRKISLVDRALTGAGLAVWHLWNIVRNAASTTGLTSFLRKLLR